MEIAEVQDKASLQRYLEGLPEEEQRKVSIRVAWRSAARVLPLAALGYVENSDPRKREAIAVSVFGALSISAVSVFAPITFIASAAAASEAYAAADRIDVRAAATAAAGAAETADDFEANLDLTSVAALAATRACAAARSTYDIDLWRHVRADLSSVDETPLWQKEPPQMIAGAWRDAKISMQSDTLADWSFWIKWYELIADGCEFLPKEMAPILNKLRKKDWEKGPAHINPLFDGVLAQYRAQDAETELGNAVPVDFSFDAMAKVMRMVGIDNNMAHLRAPEVAQAFVDDSEEVRDLFVDFTDYAGDLKGTGNHAGVLIRATEKVLKEFQRTKNQTHLRAEMLITIASELEAFSKDQKARADLGETLAGMLDTRIGKLKALCRKHFGPSYVTLAPLAQLTLDQISQEAVLDLFDDAISRIENLPSANLVKLDHEGLAVLHDMRRELTDFRAAIGEASTEEFQAMLEGRFAQVSGALGLTLNRFYFRSAAAGGKLADKADQMAKRGKQVKNLWDILQSVSENWNGEGL